MTPSTSLPRPLPAPARLRGLLPFGVLPALGALAVLAACMGDHGHGTAPPPEYFTTSVEGLEPVSPMDTVDLADGDTLVLTAAPVKKVLRGRETRMFAYNGSIPGPLVRVSQGARVTVRLRNRLGIPTTLHPHGLRLQNAFDGSPDVQREIADQDSFDYQLTFPDPGAFWYHPHLREAYGLEMGLYGNILVAPADSTYWRPANRVVPLILDDVLTDSAGIVPFRKDGADHTMMGRFGNVYLVNGDTAATLTVRRKELVRFHMTNACNTRVLNIGLHKKDFSGVFIPISMAVVGSDLGRYERLIKEPYELLAPGERLSAEMWFEDTTTLYLMHWIDDLPRLRRFDPLATIRVLPDSVDTPYGERFHGFDTSAHAIASIDSVRRYFDNPVDRGLLLTVKMDHHLMKRAHEDAAGKGVEWEDHPVGGMDNAASNHLNTRWIIRDTATGKENHAIDWAFSRGDKVKIRIRNDPKSSHPMPHPIHFHGQRFLVLKQNGVKNTRYLVWKDTYLVGRGETVEILLDAANPGKWMMHCHLAEHLESMMMFNYTVSE